VQSSAFRRCNFSRRISPSWNQDLRNIITWQASHPVKWQSNIFPKWTGGRLRKNNACILRQNSKNNWNFKIIIQFVINKISANVLVEKKEYISIFFVFFDQMCTTLLICISNHVFLICFKYKCNIINFLLSSLARYVQRNIRPWSFC
jgi:hypothetical protein